MPERPLECSECKKPVTVQYTEVLEERVVRTIMCADCPQLEKKLYGKKAMGTSEEETKPYVGELVCASCNTTLEAVRTGHPLGCPSCYDVFGDVIIEDLLKRGKISKHLTSNKTTMPLHIGRAPGEPTEVNPTLRLIALNEALDETLVREDYETAALLRDQIQALKKKIKPHDE